MPLRKKREIPAETFHFWIGEGFALKIRCLQELKPGQAKFRAKGALWRQNGGARGLDGEPTRALLFPNLETRGISSVGRALQWHCRGHRFKSVILHSKAACEFTCGFFRFPKSNKMETLRRFSSVRTL
jgi:hypothetical protein